jgi:hypothetical protein
MNIFVRSSGYSSGWIGVWPASEMLINFFGCIGDGFGTEA